MSLGVHTSPLNISIYFSFAENTRIQISEAEYIAQETAWSKVYDTTTHSSL